MYTPDTHRSERASDDIHRQIAEDRVSHGSRNKRGNGRRFLEGLYPRLGTFMASIAMTALVPFIVLFVPTIFKNVPISNDRLLLAAGVAGMGLCASTKWLFSWRLGMFTVTTCALLYGLVVLAEVQLAGGSSGSSIEATAQQYWSDALVKARLFGWVILAAVASFTVLERFERHVIRGEEFPAHKETEKQRRIRADSIDE